MKKLDLTSLETGSHYVLLNSENNVMAIIRVADDTQTTANKIEQAIREDKCLESEDLVVLISATPKSCDLLFKAKITQDGDDTYTDEFSLIKTAIY